MGWFAVNGTGLTLHGAERVEGGRVRFTIWFSVVWVPLIPITSYTAVYRGENTGAIPGESHGFSDVQKIPHDAGRLIRTLAVSWAVALLAVAPALYMIFRTSGRAATDMEMAFVFAACFWVVGVLVWSEKNRKKALEGK